MSNPSKTRVFIVDDHEVVRQGIGSLLHESELFEVVGEAGDGESALSKIKAMDNKPHVVLMDVNMPKMDGLECTRQLTTNYPEINVLVLTMVKQNTHIKSILKEGAIGYILKDSDRNELYEAIKTVSQGDTYFSTEVSQEIMKQLAKPKNRKFEHEVSLSIREKEVLELIVKDKSNKEIAEALYISIRTVESHKQNLLAKTHTNSIAGLVVYAMKNKLVDMD